MADCWNLKNTNPGATRPAMMTVQAQSSSEPEISSNPTELDRPVDEYTHFIPKKLYRPWAQVSCFQLPFCRALE